MYRWIILGIIGYILYKLVTNELRARQNRNNPTQEGSARDSAPAAAGKGSDMVKDPVCGTYVDAVSSISVRDGETVYRFCGYECRDKFLHTLRNTRSLPDENNE